MIDYKYPHEKEIVLHYATLLKNETALKLITEGSVSSNEEVKIIAKFYWAMVDRSIEEDELQSGKYDDMEKWLERIYTSLHIYFNNNGYGDIWDNEIP